MIVIKSLLHCHHHIPCDTCCQVLTRYVLSLKFAKVISITPPFVKKWWFCNLCHVTRILSGYIATNLSVPSIPNFGMRRQNLESVLTIEATLNRKKLFTGKVQLNMKFYKKLVILGVEKLAKPKTSVFALIVPKLPSFEVHIPNFADPPLLNFVKFLRLPSHSMWFVDLQDGLLTNAIEAI